ncbi:hypothetical protein FA13DRAFT_1807856 [Coprinellus micaceus]|uniref:C2H2-type domain-containing protein n=1 Tax=Coprinellus micaceus TaxID=71717 RepID=A0A4Y7R4E6_COPMI|nr:hypothetical protein FA13DRAFT_1807856 [Coprinellus micaceus]
MPRNNHQKLQPLLPCHIAGCPRQFKAQQGRTRHMHSQHPNLAGHHISAPTAIRQAPLTPSSHPPSDQGDVNISEEDGEPCTEDGHLLPPGSPPPPLTTHSDDNWTPFEDEVQFCIADFLYRHEEMSQENIDTLLHFWGLTLMKHGAEFGPFNNYTHIFNIIDGIEQGDAPWQCMKVQVQEDVDVGSPSWKKKTYEVRYRDPDTVLANLLSNPDFKHEFNYCPYVHLDKNGKRRWSDFMSGNYAWTHSDKIFNSDNGTRGATYVPIILGSDKTTFLVATGDIEYHPLYISIGNIHNNVRRAHRNAVVPIAFLAIPKGERKNDKDPDFRYFKRQLYHATIAAIFAGLKPHMSTPVGLSKAGAQKVIKCFSSFLDFCYLVRRNDIDTQTLSNINKSLHQFHQHREFFRQTGMREDDFSLPCHHSLVHYCDNIHNFSAPNGLCSSIAESRHITAVKKPWRRSNRYEALGQMLLINQRLDKLAAARSHYVTCKMLRPERLQLLRPLPTMDGEGWAAGSDVGEGDRPTDEWVLADVKLARTKGQTFVDPATAASELDIPDLPNMLKIFLQDQLGDICEDDSDADTPPLDYISSISTFHSAVAMFFAPSCREGRHLGADNRGR